MPFPRAKANMEEYGIHVPLAVRWPSKVPAGRTVETLVSFVDFAPTFLEAAGVPAPREMVGRSFLGRLGGGVDAEDDYILSGRERHTHARYDNLGYPSRALRTRDYLYIWNVKPDRWPVGDPEGYEDIDASPSKTFLFEHGKEYPKLHELAFAKRPEEELYDLRRDPSCMENLAPSNEHGDACRQLRDRLMKLLTEQGDPRIAGSDVFDSYPRVSGMRPELGGFAQQGEYNPKYQGK
jgi:uncharacterized sulfatase